MAAPAPQPNRWRRMRRVVVVATLALLAAGAGWWSFLRVPGLHKRMSIKAERGSLFQVVFSPDGATLATLGEERVLRLWEVTTGRLKAAIDLVHEFDFLREDERVSLEDFVD